MRLTEITAAPGSLTFRVENLNYHHGQSDRRLVAYRDRQEVGHIEFSDYQGEPAVKFISVPEQFRRSGVGTAMVQELQRNYPGVEINMGMHTDMGHAMLNSMPQTTTPNDEYAELVKRREQLQAQVDQFQRMADEFHTAPTEEARQHILTIADQWNAATDEIDGIDQRLAYMRPETKTYTTESLDLRQVPHDPNYLYHGTSQDRLYDILSAGKLGTFRPWHGTEQESWPDGSTDKRSYWGPSPAHVEPFIPDHPPAVVRALHQHVKARAERGTGDFYAAKPVSTRHLEYFDGAAWRPMADLANGAVAQG